VSHIHLCDWRRSPVLLVTSHLHLFSQQGSLMISRRCCTTLSPLLISHQFVTFRHAQGWRHGFESGGGEQKNFF